MYIYVCMNKLHVEAGSSRIPLYKAEVAEHLNCFTGGLSGSTIPFFPQSNPFFCLKCYLWWWTFFCLVHWGTSRLSLVYYEVLFVQLWRIFLEHLFQLYFEIIPNSITYDDESFYEGVNMPFSLISLKRQKETNIKTALYPILPQHKQFIPLFVDTVAQTSISVQLWGYLSMVIHKTRHKSKRNTFVKTIFQTLSRYHRSEGWWSDRYTGLSFSVWRSNTVECMLV